MRLWAAPRMAGELAAIVVLVLVGVRAARAWHGYRRDATAETKDMVGVLVQPGIILGDLDGVGIAGHLISPITTPQTRILIFLLRPDTAMRDMAFWGRLAENFAGTPELQFRGFCEGTACGKVAAVSREAVVLQAGGARTMVGLMQADRRGDALLMGASVGRILADATGAAFTAPSRFRCALIQYTSTICPYCNESWQTAASLARQSAQAGCRLVTLAPSPGQLPIRQAQPHEVQLGWIKPGWLAGLPRLELEPTFVLLGTDGTIVWNREGVLSAADVTAAMSSLHATFLR